MGLIKRVEGSPLFIPFSYDCSSLRSLSKYLLTNITDNSVILKTVYDGGIALVNPSIVNLKRYLEINPDTNIESYNIEAINKKYPTGDFEDALKKENVNPKLVWGIFFFEKQSQGLLSTLYFPFTNECVSVYYEIEEDIQLINFIKDQGILDLATMHGTLKVKNDSSLKFSSVNTKHFDEIKESLVNYCQEQIFPLIL